MPYAFKPDADDVILSTWEERDRLHVSLSLREGDDGSGPTVVEWWDDEAVQAFEDGFLKRSRTPGRISDKDSTLLESALEYARERKMPVLEDFARDVSARVDAIADALPAAYDELDAAEPAEADDDPENRRECLIEEVVAKALKERAAAGDLPKVSDARLDDIESHLQESLREALDARPAAPAP